MTPLRARSAAVLAAAFALCACEFSDPLSAISNGDGMSVVDSLKGWNHSSRTICLWAEGSNTSCSSWAAEVYITEVPNYGQVEAEWRNGDPKTVDVFVIGGTIERCRNRSRNGGITITLRQLPLSRMPPPGIWSPASSYMFEGLPDLCGLPA